MKQVVRLVFSVILFQFLLSAVGLAQPAALPTRRFVESTVSALPAASSVTSQVYLITDALTVGQCTAGSGSFKQICRSNGSTWEPIGVSNTPVLKSINGVKNADQWCTTPGVLDESCFTNSVANNTLVIVPPGTYSFTNPLTFNNLVNATVYCETGAVIQANSSFPSGWPLFSLTGSGTDVSFTGPEEGGCVFDGNSFAETSVQWQDTTTRGSLQHAEIKNMQTGTKDGIILYNSGGVFHLEHNYIHDVGDSAVRTLGGFHGDLYVMDSNFGPNITGHHIMCTGAAHCNVSGNSFYSLNTAQNAIYALGDDQIDWEQNYVNGGAGDAMHADTVGGGIIAHNQIYNTTGTISAIFCEASPNCIVESNVVEYTSGVGTAIGSTGVIPTGLRTQVNALDSTTGLTACTNVTLTLDSSDKLEGTNALVATMAAGFAVPGCIFYQNTTSSSWLVHPNESVWIKAGSAAVNAGDLSIILSCTTAISTQNLVVPIGYIAANQWARQNIYPDNWNNVVNGCTISSWGIYAQTTSLASKVLKFDDYGNQQTTSGSIMRNNMVRRVKGTCYSFGDLTNGGLIDGNYCEDPMYSVSTNRQGFQTFWDTNVVFTNNEVRFTQFCTTSACTTGSGQNISVAVDANTSLVEDNTKSTNHDTMFSITAGGSVNQKANSRFIAATPSASISGSFNLPSGSGNTAVAGDYWRDSNGFNWLDSTSVNGGFRFWDQASHNRLDDTTGTITAFTVHHPAAAPTTASVEATDTCGSATCAESWIHAARVCFLIADHGGSSSATLGTITWSNSCTFPVAASTVYTVSCDVQSTSTNAAGGLFMGWTGPGTPTASNYTLSQATSATATGYHNISTTTTYSTSGAGVVAQTITTVWPAHFAGTFENGTNAGTLSIQFANGSATGSTVLKRGSFCTVT